MRAPVRALVGVCLIIVLVVASLIANGSAIAGVSIPEVDPSTATGTFVLFAVGAALLIERYRGV